MKNKQNNFGFTLVEMMIFIVIAGLLITMLLSTLTTFYKARKTARRIDILETTAAQIITDLTQEVHWSKEVTELDTTHLKLTQPSNDPENPDDDREIIYTYGGNQFSKDGQPLSPDDVEVTCVIKDLNEGVPDSVPLLEITLQLKHIAEGSEPKVVTEHKATISLRKNITSLPTT